MLMITSVLSYGDHILKCLLFLPVLHSLSFLIHYIYLLTFLPFLSLSLFSVLSSILRHPYLLLLQSSLRCSRLLTLLPPPFLIILTAPFSILSSFSYFFTFSFLFFKDITKFVFIVNTFLCYIQSARCI